MTDQHWQFERDGQKVGPLRLEEIQQLARIGTIRPDTVLLHDNGSQVPARDLLTFDMGMAKDDAGVGRGNAVALATVSDAIPPLPPPPPPPPYRPEPTATSTTIASPVAPPPPWDPVVVARLGILFTPHWAAIMATINGTRLGLFTPRWRPLSVVTVALVLDVLFCFLVCPLYLVHLAFYLGSLVLLWRYDLQPQVTPFAQQGQKGKGWEHWLAPVMLALPLLVVVAFAFVVIPLKIASPPAVSSDLSFELPHPTDAKPSADEFPFWGKLYPRNSLAVWS